MREFVLKRTLTAVLVFLGATFVTHALMALAPGDVAMEIAAARYGGVDRTDAATVEWIRKTEGLDKPFHTRYFLWLKRVLALDLGTSLVEEAPVRELIAARFFRTLELAAAAILVALLVSVPLGFLAGMRKGTWVDSLGSAVGVLGLSIPNYWLGIVLIIVFSVKLRWFPAFGHGGPSHIVLPAVTLGTALTAYTTRVLRSAVIETRGADYIRALPARGVESRPVVWKHILKHVSIPVITVVGLEFGMILEGAVITETVFAWPGLGELMVSAVGNRDYPLIQGMVLFTSAVFVLINFAVDIAYRYLDPRVRP